MKITCSDGSFRPGFVGVFIVVCLVVSAMNDGGFFSPLLKTIGDAVAKAFGF